MLDVGSCKARMASAWVTAPTGNVVCCFSDGETCAAAGGTLLLVVFVGAGCGGTWGFLFLSVLSVAATAAMSALFVRCSYLDGSFWKTIIWQPGWLDCRMTVPRSWVRVLLFRARTVWPLLYVGTSHRSLLSLIWGFGWVKMRVTSTIIGEEFGTGHPVAVSVLLTTHSGPVIGLSVEPVVQLSLMRPSITTSHAVADSTSAYASAFGRRVRGWCVCVTVRSRCCLFLAVSLLIASCFAIYIGKNFMLYLHWA